MSCDEARELFSDHVDGALGVAQEDQLGEHFVACESCRAALREYEADLSSLAGASPSPPEGMETRVLRALEAARRSERSHGWALRFAPVLATLAAGVVLGMLIGHRRAQERTPIVPVQCAAALPRSIALDLDAYAGSPDVRVGEIEVGVGRTTLRLPRRLISRGPYRPDTTLLVAENGSACLPLRAAYGSHLLLSAIPLDRPASSGPEYRIDADPARVFYRRVSWESGSYSWILEGRADAAELLALAQELVAHTTVSSTASNLCTRLPT